MLDDREAVSGEDFWPIKAVTAIIERNESRQVSKRLAWTCAVLAIALVATCAGAYLAIQGVRQEYRQQLEILEQGSKLEGRELPPPLDVGLPMRLGNSPLLNFWGAIKEGFAHDARMGYGSSKIGVGFQNLGIIVGISQSSHKIITIFQCVT